MLPIGSAFPHQVGRRLQRHPASVTDPGDGTCKIVLRPPKEDKNDQHGNDKEAHDERIKQAVRQSNDRLHGRVR
jgi:hypothetical protein